MYFSLGKAYEDKKDYELSFKYYSLANTTKRRTFKYDFSEENRSFENIKKLFKEEFIKNELNTKRFNDKKIIFICGMPRSGTTLTEQIISSHSKIKSLGETDHLLQIIDNKIGLNDHKKLMSQTFKILHESPNEIFNDYYDYLKDLRTEKKIFTDKSLLNFKLIGFIKIFFPNSKIIVLKRDFRNNFFSIFKNDLASKKLRWTYSKEEISIFYKLFLNYLDFWNSVEKNMFFEVEYEKLISEPRLITEQILNYCEVDWEDNCLNYHKVNKSAIDTASANQANKPIYKNSINNFSNYEKFFQKKTP